jgi:SOS regulatory protein LexA
MDEIQFGAYLKSLRQQNKLTIRQLMDKSGVSNAYLSQLENGKRGLPSPEILMKIHGPLKVGYDELMEKAGYISPKVRSELLVETVQALGRADREFENGLPELIENASELFIKSITDTRGDLNDGIKILLADEIRKVYPTLSPEDINGVINNPEFLKQIFEYLTLEEKIIFLNILIKGFVKQGVDPGKVFKNISEESSPPNYVPILKVPVLGYIAAGQPILAEEHIEEWTEIPNNWNLKDGEVIILKVKGDSMIGSRIYDGDKVVVKLQQNVENGEIAVVNVNGYEATLKRVRKTENGQVILFPDNPKYDPIFITNEGARIIGKVIQVMFDPK